MPTPRPMRRHRLRSWRVPWTNRGYHASGTTTVRPSVRSTASSLSVTLTCSARASWGSVVEVLIPTPQQSFAVAFHQALYLLDLYSAKSATALQPNRVEPELGDGVVTLHVDVRCFIAVPSYRRGSGKDQRARLSSHGGIYRHLRPGTTPIPHERPNYYSTSERIARPTRSALRIRGVSVAGSERRCVARPATGSRSPFHRRFRYEAHRAGYHPGLSLPSRSAAGLCTAAAAAVEYVGVNDDRLRLAMSQQFLDSAVPTEAVCAQARDLPADKSVCDMQPWPRSRPRRTAWCGCRTRRERRRGWSCRDRGRPHGRTRLPPPPGSSMPSLRMSA